MMMMHGDRSLGREGLVTVGRRRRWSGRDRLGHNHHSLAWRGRGSAARHSGTDSGADEQRASRARAVVPVVVVVIAVHFSGFLLGLCFVVEGIKIF